jgi:hypothetical protein
MYIFYKYVLRVTTIGNASRASRAPIATRFMRLANV